MTDEDKQFCGFVAILGRPNVGKSTLLNKLLGQKISITSRKPQTTRHRIVGIDTEDEYQTIFVDTPGVQRKHDSAIHRYMNRAATSTIEDVDAIILVVDRLNWTDEDEYVVQSIRQSTAPVILAINKVDHLVEKNRLLPHIQALSAKRYQDTVEGSADFVVMFVPGEHVLYAAPIPLFYFGEVLRHFVMLC